MHTKHTVCCARSKPVRCAVVVAFLFVYVAQAADKTPDYVLFNGRIFTSNPKQLHIEALAVQGERILAVGPSHSQTLCRSSRDQRGAEFLLGRNESYAA